MTYPARMPGDEPNPAAESRRRSLKYAMLGVAGLAMAIAILSVTKGTAFAAQAPLSLFTGKDLTGWIRPTGDWLVAKGVSLDPANPQQLVITPGQDILVNGPTGRTVDLITEPEFGDVKVHVEFCIPKGSNSGIYLMGR